MRGGESQIALLRNSALLNSSAPLNERPNFRISEKRIRRCKNVGPLPLTYRSDGSLIIWKLSFSPPLMLTLRTFPSLLRICFNKGMVLISSFVIRVGSFASIHVPLMGPNAVSPLSEVTLIVVLAAIVDHYGFINTIDVQKNNNNTTNKQTE